MKSLISINGKNAMKNPKINKGPERYTVVQLKRLDEKFKYCKREKIGDYLETDHVIEFLSWLEEQ